LKEINPQVPVMILSALPFLPPEAPDCIDSFTCKGETTDVLVAKIQHMIETGARKPAHSVPAEWRQASPSRAEAPQFPSQLSGAPLRSR
jgi:hypothetical protein